MTEKAYCMEFISEVVLTATQFREWMSLIGLPADAHARWEAAAQKDRLSASIETGDVVTAHDVEGWHGAQVGVTRFMPNWEAAKHEKLSAVRKACAAKGWATRRAHAQVATA